jgi:hypothetical protein
MTRSTGSFQRPPPGDLRAIGEDQRTGQPEACLNSGPANPSEIKVSNRTNDAHSGACSVPREVLKRRAFGGLNQQGPRD